MFGVIRDYQIEPGRGDEILGELRTNFVPLIAGARGFVSYTLAFAADDRAISTTIFEDREGARNSTREAADFVEALLAGMVVGPPSVTEGEVVVRSARPSAAAHFGVLRRSFVKSGSMPEIADQIRTGLVPVLEALPGFVAYALIDVGHHEVVSLGTFADLESAQAGNEVALAWIRVNLAQFTDGPREVLFGEIRIRETTVAAAV